MRELALFAGVGGGILGGKLLGWQTVCAVEINAYCARRLMQRQNEGHLPPFPIWGIEVIENQDSRWSCPCWGAPRYHPSIDETRRMMTMPSPEITATVSGSFRRHMEAVAEAVRELQHHGVRVLSPEDPRIVDREGDFLYVASDRVRSIRLVQDRHLSSIRSSSFLWLVCPDGYVGPSAAMELGCASAAEVPIYASRAPDDLTMRRYVRTVSGIAEAVRIAEAERRSRPQPNLLIDPLATLEDAHRKLDELRRLYEKIAARQSSVTDLYDLSDDISRSFHLTQPVIDE